MRYIGRAPTAPLDRFVDDVYCLTGMPRHRRLNVPPMPSCHLMINLAGPVWLRDSDPAIPPAQLTDAWFTGVWTRRFLIEYRTAVHVVGVHFKPWGLSPFVSMPSSELRNGWLPADALWGRSVGLLRERLADAPSVDAMLRLVEAELLSRVAPRRGLELVHRTAAQLHSTWGTVPIGSLTDGAGVSSNHLAAQFRSHVGVTPKQVARIYRFARLILSIDATRPVNWSQLALAAGYFDQAHLGREFKGFTGHTPGAYLELRRRFPARDGFPPDDGPMPAE